MFLGGRRSVSYLADAVAQPRVQLEALYSYSILSAAHSLAGNNKNNNLEIPASTYPPPSSPSSSPPLLDRNRKNAQRHVD